MVKLATIQREIREIEKRKVNLLHKRAQDQAYGAVEALRWVLGEGPPPKYLAMELN